jgi:predicted RNase H-like HicB family nuclease
MKVQMKYAIVIEKTENNSAYVPDLPGCITPGKPLEETRRLMQEAIEFHIEGLRTARRSGAPQLLDADERSALGVAKERARRREAAESTTHLINPLWRKIFFSGG